MPCQSVKTCCLAGLWILGGVGLSLASHAAQGESPTQDAPAATSAGSLVIPAYAYDRGNPRTYRPGETYADADVPVRELELELILAAWADPRHGDRLFVGKEPVELAADLLTEL